MEKGTSEHPPHPGHAFCWFWKYSDPFFHDKNFLKILVCFVFCRCLLKIRSRTPVRSHFHRAQSHPHPPLQHSCGWLLGEAISPITRALVVQGTEIKASILQSVSRWAATRFLSHWEVCNNLTGLKWKKHTGQLHRHLDQIHSQQIFMEKRLHRQMQVKPVTLLLHSVGQTATEDCTNSTKEWWWISTVMCPSYLTAFL